MGGKHMKRIYIAGPMFSVAELKYNEEIAKKLEASGFNVFLPQREGYKMVELLETMRPEEARKLIFNKDYEAVKSADIILIILDGRIIDEGACVELGIGYVMGKLCVGLKTDPRTMMNGQMNPMVSECLAATYSSVDDLVTYICREKM